ncbi:hypothetical protein Goari_021302 [Gossypium aridum]|uniref:Uncharacterized protein n=1 Tax=Gossypium aridum TaxID=34290 RepID=A0A7J8YDW3_GOSAI|nr:hypothetical protein [Gossypium aridum]
MEYKLGKHLRQDHQNLECVNFTTVVFNLQ